MGKLQDFREQYPQYGSIDDETLAAKLHETYYPDMDPAEYRTSLGLAPMEVDKPDPEPTMSQRIGEFTKNVGKSLIGAVPFIGDDLVASSKNDLTDFDLPDEPTLEDPPASLFRDQFFGAWDGWRANVATTGSIRLAEAHRDAELNARGELGGMPGPGEGAQAYDKLFRARRADAYRDDPEKYPDFKVDFDAIAAETQDQRAQLYDILQEQLDHRATLSGRTATITQSGATQRTIGAEGFGETVGAFWDDPLVVMAEVSLQSLPNMAESAFLAIAGGLSAGPAGFAVGGGAGSAATEYRASLAEGLMEAGVDLNDARSLLEAVENQELMGAVRKTARIRAGIIGTFDAGSGGLATKVLGPQVKSVMAREITNAVLQAPAQAALGGSGEALAQLATDGEIHAGQVFAEIIGEGPTSVVEVGAASISGARAQSVQNKISEAEAELAQILGRDTTPAPEPAAQPENDVSRDTPDEVELEPELPKASPETPVVFVDPRLKRKTYREGLRGLADELVPGGGVTYVRDENDVIVGRTPSLNPEWFQSLVAEPETKVSVRQAVKAVDKAIAGHQLGVREERVVRAMLDTATDQRLEQVDYAKQQLERARIVRRDAADFLSVPVEAYEEYSGELFNENEYAADMTADSRIMYELMDQAESLGVDVERLAIRYDDDVELIGQLQRALNDASNTPSTETTAPQPQPVAASRASRDTDTGDLFGTDNRLAQEVADEIARRDQARNTGQTELETGDPADLFSQAQQQTDISDPVRSARRPATQEDRRRDPNRADRIKAMSTDQLVDLLYTNELTGIANRRAFEEEQDLHPYLASIDADSLKFINDNLSPDAGDAMLIAVAEALDQTGVDAYHISGDEFYLGADSREELQAAVDLAKATLSQQRITSPRGHLQGPAITYGIAKTKDMADGILKQQKTKREAAGKRAPRGTAPKGAVLSVKAKVLDMAPGTNYAPMIGQTGQLPIDAQQNMVLGNGRPVRIPKKPVRREHILARMQQAFGLKIYQGRVKGKSRLGFFRRGHGEIRIKNANDIEVAAHEVAHWIDDRHPWVERLYKQFDEEIRSVSYDVTLDYEGYAEFMRLFMTQEPEAMKRTPGFYDAWRKELAEHPKLEAMVYDIQEMMHAWTMQGARARLASKHASEGPPFIEKIREITGQVDFLQKALDGLRSIKTAELDVTDGKTTEAYNQMRLAVGGSAGTLEAAVMYGTPTKDADGQGYSFNGESLLEVFGDHWGSDLYAQYGIARRAQELKGQGRENLIRDDEIAAGLAIADEYPEFAEIHDKYQAWNGRMLDFYQQLGIIGTTTRAAIQEANKSYLPFHRVVESLVDGRKVQNTGNPFKRLKGGTQNIANVWDNIVMNTGMLIRTGMVNDAKRTLFQKIGGANNQKGGLYAAPIEADVKPVTVQGEQVVKMVVESMGMTMRQYKQAEQGFAATDEEQATVEMINRIKDGVGELATFFKTNVDPTGDVDFYMEGGRKKWFEIADPGLWDSLKFLGPKGTNLVVGMFGLFSSTLRRGVVAIPGFQVKNFQRDTTNSWLLGKHKVPAIKALRVVFSRMQKDPDYQEMMLNGGGFANRSQGLNQHRKMIINPLRAVAWYDRFMGRFENANRLAEYKLEKKRSGNKQQASMLSRDISTDFAMRGSHEAVRFLAIAVPFLNARAQGLYRVARQFTGKEAAISFAVKGGMLMTASLALYAMNKDDERYEELPEDIKDLYWVFFTGTGEDEYVLIPKPFEAGMMWGTLPERMMEYTEERDGKEFADALSWMFLETFNADLTPQMFQPELDIAKNKKFTGAPIIPFYLDNVEPSQQYTYYTSLTAIEAGEKFGISPIKLEHRFRGYLGTLGTYALGMSDAMVRAATEDPHGEKPTRGETWRENILVKGLIDSQVNEGPARRTKSLTDLYELARQTERVSNTVALMQRRQDEGVVEYLDDPENQMLLAANEPIQAVKSSLRELRLTMDAVRQSPDLSGDEKRGQLWQLTRERNDLVRQAVTEINQLLTEAEDNAQATTP